MAQALFEFIIITGRQLMIAFYLHRSRNGARSFRTTCSLVLRWCVILAVSLDGFGLSSILQAAERPNFLVVYLDDLGWTNTSVQMDPNVPFSKSDYYQTPTLEQMAAEGMRFNNAYSGGPICSPSRSALMTGRTTAQVQQTHYLAERIIDRSNYGNNPTITPIPFHLLEEITTLPERLNQYFPDYVTAKLRKDHMGSNPLNFGFDISDFHQFGYEVPGDSAAKVFAVANHANSIMESSVQDDKPFFLYVCPEAIHTPFNYTASSYNYMSGLPLGSRHKSTAAGAMLYDADLAIGQMLDKIDQLGIADNTYVIFTSDNGGTGSARNNEPLFGSKGTLYEGGVRIPMIVRGPGIAPGSISSVPVSQTDLFATVSELAGITAPFEPGLESASLVPILQNGGQLPLGETLSRGVATSGEIFWHFPHYSSLGNPSSAIRDGDFKLVKFYGQNGAADSVLLFNLTNNITETSNVNSPLNLANSMPAKTSEMLAKLDGWLQAVDAPMPHNIATDVHLDWDASDLNTQYSSLWRSKNKVSDLRRETWEIIPERVAAGPTPTNQIAQRVDVSPYQPGLGDKAFRFDGNDVMARPFFNVSDAAHLKSDNSATFDFWFRLTNLNPNKPQVLMETGDATGGLSLTLGDADSNGKSNDLRFRVRSINGAGYTITVPIDQFANPVNDFIQATAVINDSNNNRQIELYINGALAGTVAGTPGAGAFIDWDNGDLAGLGKFAGTGICGNGGSGALPFSGGFDGQVAEMGFYTYALTASQIQASYNSKLSPADENVVASLGDAVIPNARPTNVSFNATELDSTLVVQERSDVLKSPLTVDAIADNGMLLSSPAQAQSGILPGGTSFTSYLFHLDPVNDNPLQTISSLGTITFAGEILGIIFDDASLAATDPSLGSLGNYGTSVTRGLNLGSEGSLLVSNDLKSITFDLEVAGDDMLQFRVLTSLATFAEADFDQSGAVDQQDLSIWQGAFGQGAGGDADGDGDTDGRDFLIWQRQLTGASGQGELAAVPEPATLSLIFFLGIAGFSGRPPRRSWV
jgi:arylsulfatase A